MIRILFTVIILLHGQIFAPLEEMPLNRQPLNFANCMSEALRCLTHKNVSEFCTENQMVAWLMPPEVTPQLAMALKCMERDRNVSVAEKK